MPRTTGPLFSLSASGSIAKTIVYSSWRGIKYARQRVVPANPRTVKQIWVRSLMTWFSALYKFLPTAATEALEAAAAGRPVTARNLLVSENLTALYANDLTTPLVLSPGAGAAPAPPTVTFADAGAGHVTATITAFPLPAGWTFVSHTLVVIAETAPSVTAFDELLASATEALQATPCNADASALRAGAGTAVHWAKLTRPDGSPAYTRSTSDTVNIS